MFAFNLIIKPMKSVLTGIINIRYVALGALLLGQPARATVTYVGNDWTTGPSWRTPSVVKINDIDGDNIYGSEGYYLPSGLDADEGDDEKNPFLTVNNVITGNPYEINTLPSYILDLKYSDPAERGQSWGGARNDEGTLDLVPGGFTGEAGAGILLGNLNPTNIMSLTLQRSNAPAFRLTLIFGNTAWNLAPGNFTDPLGYDSGLGMNVTLDDGSGAVGPQESGDASLGNMTSGFVTYQSWDISAGSSDVVLTLASYNGTDIPRLSGLAIDSLPPVAPSILTQPQGSTNFVGSPISLSVTAVGTALTYQWMQNSNAIPSATSWGLTLLNSVTTNSGSYQVVVSNSVSVQTSAVAMVQVQAIPTTVIYADSLSNNAGGSLNGRTPDTTDTTSAVWSADPDWLMSGTSAVDEATGSEFNGNAWLPFTPVAGRFYTLSAVLDDPAGGTGWVILGFADSVTDTNGAWWEYGTTYGMILARDDGDASDNQWFFGPGTANGGETHLYSTGPATNTVILDTTPTEPANWTFTFLVNGAVVQPAVAASHFGLATGPVIGAVGFGSLDNNATVTSFSLAEQTPPSAPYVVTQPVGGTNFPGDSITLSVTVGGSDPLTFQWQMEPLGGNSYSNITNATNASLIFTNLGLSDSGFYQVVLHNPLGSTNSAATEVLVIPVPAPTATNTIYQDMFSGSGSLNGRKADTFDATGATWLANTNWLTDGTSAYAEADAADFIGNAFLPFVPLPNRIYTLSAGLEDLPGAGWVAIGYVSDNTTNGYFHVPANGVPPPAWLLERPDDSGLDDLAFIGPGYNNFDTGIAPTGPNLCSIILDTREAQHANWTVTYLINGAVVQPATALGYTPSITYVGFGGLNDGAIVTNFVLTEQVVPGPTLQVASGGPGTVILSWPTTVGEYALQSSPVLGPAAVWSPVTVTNQIVGGFIQVTVTAGGKAGFYRLSRP
jgi:hypothetical protein